MVAWAAAGAALKAAAPAIGRFAGSALGGLLGGSSGSSVGFDINASKELMDYQDKLTREQSQWLNENSYTHMRTGLEKAGYNPLLAVGATPQNGSVGLGAPMSSNTASYDGQKAIEALNTMADTAKTKSGVLGSIFGTDLVNVAKQFGNSSGITKGLEKLIKKSLNTANGAIDTIDKVTDKVNEKYKNFTLKGYVSNTANSEFNYAPEYDELGRLPRALSRYK